MSNNTKQITIEKVEYLIQKLREKPTVNSIFYFTKVLKICLGGADSNSEAHDEEQEFIIEEGETFDLVLKFGLQEFPQILKKQLLPQQKSLVKQFKEDKFDQQLEKHPNILKYIKGKRVEIILKVYLFNFFKFFSQLHEDEMILYCLQNLPEISDLMHVFPNLMRRLEKHLIELWASADVIPIKLRAFIALRKLAAIKNEQDHEKLFRKIYITFVKNVKYVNWRNYELVIFMINCFNELLVINYDAAYVIAFSYLRQIAITLKELLSIKSAEAERQLYNWEVINSFKVWVNVICKNEQLEQLTYPLVELIQGVITYHKQNEYIPTHLHLLRLLVEIQEKTGQYIPVLKLIKEFLSMGIFTKKKLVKNTKLKPYDFFLNLKVEVKYAKAPIFWNEVFKQLLDLSLITLSKFSTNPEFPEISYNFIKFLTRLQKNVQFIAFKMQIKETINAIKKNQQQVLNVRLPSNVAPYDIDQAIKPMLKQESELEKVSKKILAEREANLKQRIAAEKNQFMGEGNEFVDVEDDDEEGEGDEDQEDYSEEGDEQDKGKEDDESYDFAQDVEEGEEEEVAEQDYDLEEMDYEGDPEEYVSDEEESEEDDE